MCVLILVYFRFLNVKVLLIVQTVCGNNLYDCRLLELGFEDFVRVGSVKKIAKPVLPFR